MRKKSHILLARYLADQMPANESLQSHRKAFCLGNILPDIQPSFITKRHEYFGTFDEVQGKIRRLVQVGENYNDRVFWRRAGEVMHYIADYFTFPHNKTFDGTLRQHNSYEKHLKNELKALAMEGMHFFDDDTLTDQPERVLAAEIIREKMLRLLAKEVPHGSAVVVERMREREDSNITDIDATVYCEKASHKGIIIGKGGSMLKKIGSYARADMEKFFGCKINLTIWVKVKEDWRNREGILRSLGYDERNFDN